MSAQPTKPNHRTRAAHAPRIIIVGCGAITERYHLPALARDRGVLQNLILADPNQARVQEVAAKFGVTHTVQDYRTALGEVDGAVVATPHHLHHPVTMDFLNQGIPVLCEKPLSESPHEAREMAEQSTQANVALAVNHTRRLFPAYQKIKELIEQGVLGKLVSLEYVDGWPFHWPTTSGFYFKKASPAGVLLDKGVHGLDAICWWLGGRPEVISSQNDSFGGMEGAAQLKLRHQGCDVVVKLSWLAKLKSTYRIIGEEAQVEGGIEEWGAITLIQRNGKKSRIKLPGSETAYNEFGHKMLDNFVDVVNKRAKPLVPAQEVVAAIELIDECYRVATRFPMPWMDNVEVANDR